MKLNLNQLTLLLIDTEYELMSNNSDEEVIKKKLLKRSRKN